MSRKRIVPTALALFALSACGGGVGPTASDAGLQPRFSGGVGTQGGGRSGGETTSTQEGGSTTTTMQTDSTQNGNRGGFLWSGG